MSIKYDNRRESLAEIIKKTTLNATYVIPDLQRPFVWTPSQVTMLIDSIFRGWPFGSLLLWEVKHDCFEPNEGIPSRPFWQVVDRTKSDNGSENSPMGQPATYQMVLDGQQRVQSLVLALGGDLWGFQLFDFEWALDLQDRRVKPSSHWSRASLCVDLKKFLTELTVKQSRVRKIEAGKILTWAILEPNAGQSSDQRPQTYINPVERALDNPGRFIRLSRFWDIVQRDLSEAEYKDILQPILIAHGVNETDCSSLIDPLGQYMKVIENIKENSFVHALQIESLKITSQWSKEDYADAIVNIFTRLNTAGRTLSREEITLAWLKIGWKAEHTDNKTAGQCLDELKSALGDCGFSLATDEIVRLISFVWSVESRSGDLLDSKDLLRGDIIQSMASSIACTWKSLKSSVEVGADLIRDRDLVDIHGSFNAIIVFLTWTKLITDRFNSLANKYQTPERDDVEKKLKIKSSQFLDRWVFGSQWANIWGDGAVLNFQHFATELNRFSKKLRSSDATSFLSTVDESIHHFMERITPKALEQINNVNVRDRKRVHDYFPFLWVWHRLDEERWASSSIQMRTGRKKAGKLEVDHTVASACWKRMIEDNVNSKAPIESDSGAAPPPPDEFDSEDEALAFINTLGNCTLLDKSFNVSKSDAPMRELLEKVHEFKEGKVKMSDWESALSLSETLTNPVNTSIADIKEALRIRDSLLRKELCEFINGVRYRSDA